MNQDVPPQLHPWPVRAGTGTPAEDEAEKAERVPGPASVPLRAAAVVGALLGVAVVFALGVGGWGGSFLLVAIGVYGLPFVVTLLLVAGYAALMRSRAVGVTGTVLAFVAVPVALVRIVSR